MLPALASEEYVWRADAFCANLDSNDEMYCLCSREYDIELPTISGGNSIDERVYVSDTDWQTKLPYKYVLQVIDVDDDDLVTMCTANMVRGKIVTAGHCIVDGQDRASIGDVIKLRDAYGSLFDATIEDFMYDSDDRLQDWAVLQPVGRDVKNQSIDKISHWKWRDARQGVYLPGFGALKIMNDTEIDRFQKAYIKYLQLSYPDYASNEEERIQRNTDGVKLSGRFATKGTAFVDDLLLSNFCRKYALEYGQLLPLCKNNNTSGFNYTACGLKYEDIFNDTNRLKLSRCSTDDISKYSLENGAGTVTFKRCQSWGGNSGGGFYMDDDSVYAILTRNIREVGGGRENHAGGGFNSGILVSHFEDKLPASMYSSSDVNRGVALPNDGSNDESGTQDNGQLENNNNSGNGGAAVDEDNGGGSVVVYPRLLSSCAQQDLPSNAVSGQWFSHVESDKICLDADDKQVGCTCGAWRCRDGYKRVGSVYRARCVEDASSFVNNGATSPNGGSNDKGGTPDNGGGSVVVYPRLLSSCEQQDLPSNAVSGRWFSHVESDKICLGADDKQVGCTCGAWTCRDGYKRVGSGYEARCVEGAGSSL